MSIGPRRTEVIDETLANKIRALFGHAQNAHRWLHMQEVHLPLYTMQRALRGDPCREEDLAIIEGRWKHFEQEHNFADSDFELPEIVRTKDLPTGWRRVRNPDGPTRRTNDGYYVEETYDVSDESEFF